MPKAPPRKPSGVKESFALPSWVLKCGAGVLIAAVVIGVSQYLSPLFVSEAPAAGLTPGKDASDTQAPKQGAGVVKALDDSTLDDFVAAHPDGVLVDFYAKDCKFCTKLAPEFETAAKELKAGGGPPLASISSDSGAASMQKYGIHRYPTVLWFWKGQNTLEFPRAAEKPAAKIVEWVQWAVTPAVQELETRAEFDGALATLRSSLHEKARLMVGFNREGPEAATLRDSLEAAAQRHRSTTVFLYIKEASATDVLMRSYGQDASKDEDYAGTVDKSEVIQWVKGTLEKAKPQDKATEQAAEAKSAADLAIEQVQQALQNAEEADKADKAE